MSKLNYGRKTKTTTHDHTCHWPGCNVQIPPKLWGCKSHWYMLPENLRNKIWKTYRPGQELTKDPSIEYITVAKEVQEWIRKRMVQ